MEATTHTPAPPTNPRRLTRPRDGRVLGGVAAAISHSTGIAVGFVRLVFLVLSLFGGFGLLLYAIGWILLPSSDASASPAERWLRDLRTPGQRTGAVLIGIAVLILMAPFAPAAVIVGAILLAAGLYFTKSPANTEE